MFPHNTRVYYPFELRLRGDTLEFYHFSLAEERFIQDFKERICDVEFDTRQESVKKIFPDESNHTLHIHINPDSNMTAAEISNIINEKAHRLKHLFISATGTTLKGVVLTEDLPHLKTLSIVDCSNKVLNQILSKMKNKNLYKLEIGNITGRSSAANISRAINDNAHSLKHLHLIDLDYVNVFKKLSNIKSLHIEDCSDDTVTKIVSKIKNAKLNKLHINDYEEYLEAANVNSLMNKNSYSLKHLALIGVRSTEISIKYPLQILSLNFESCDPNVVIKVLNKCTDTLLSLTLDRMKEEFNSAFPQFCKLKDLTLINCEGLETELLTKCVDTLQALSLVSMTWNLDIPLLSKLKYLKLVFCSKDVEKEVMIKCAGTVQDLILTGLNDWNIDIPPLSSLESVTFNGMCKDITDCELLTQGGNLLQLKDLQNK